MSERYLITGGAGNLACQLTFSLARLGDSITLMDIADRPAAATAPGCRYLRTDISDRAAVAKVVEELRPTTILHFASLLSGSCEENRELAWRVNMDGMFALFETAIQNGVGNIFFPSSLATYGGTLPSPLPEEHPQWPQGLYGVTKVACERLGFYYAQHHGLDFRCLRLPIVISRHAPAGAASAFASHAFIEAVRAGGYTFKVFPEPHTSAVYVRDVLRGIVQLLKAPRDRLTRPVYNLHGLSISAEQIARAISLRVPTVRFKFNADPQTASLIASWPAVTDDQDARRDWGWQPQYDAVEALADDFLAELRAEIEPS